MSLSLALPGSVAIGTLGLSMWGLFNEDRSVLCAPAGILTAPGACIGDSHAWLESRSLTRSVLYMTLAPVGIISEIRQFKTRKPGRETAGPNRR